MGLRFTAAGMRRARARALAERKKPNYAGGPDLTFELPRNAMPLTREEAAEMIVAWTQAKTPVEMATFYLHRSMPAFVCHGYLYNIGERDVMVKAEGGFIAISAGLAELSEKISVDPGDNSRIVFEFPGGWVTRIGPYNDVDGDIPPHAPLFRTPRVRVASTERPTFSPTISGEQDITADDAEALLARWEKDETLLELSLHTTMGGVPGAAVLYAYCVPMPEVILMNGPNANMVVDRGFTRNVQRITRTDTNRVLVYFDLATVLHIEEVDLTAHLQ